MNNGDFTIQIPLDCKHVGSFYLMTDTYVSMVMDIYSWFLQHPREQCKTELLNLKHEKPICCHYAKEYRVNILKHHLE